MKKFLILAVTLVGLFVGTLNSQTPFLERDQITSEAAFRQEGYLLLGINFRHHPRTGQTCNCPNCACSACSCPIGLCICINFRPVVIGEDQALTQAQIDAGMGTAWIKIEGEEMHVVFPDNANDSSGVLIVYNPDGAEAADNTDYSKFGASGIFSILNGEYTVVKTKYTYGETVVAIRFD